jgi:hypothetical protein
MWPLVEHDARPISRRMTRNRDPLAKAGIYALRLISIGDEHRLDPSTTKTDRIRRPADVESDLIRTRAAEGRNRAKARGEAYGPTPFPDTPQQKVTFAR